MFSTLYYRILQVTLFLFSLQGFLPWSWNSKSRRLCITNHIKIWNRLCALVLFSSVLFTTIRTIQARRVDIHQFVIALGFSFFAILGSFGTCFSSLYAAEVAAFVNGMLDYSVKYQKQWIPKYDADRSPKNYYFDRGLILIITCFFGIAPIVTIHYWLFPMDMIYPNSLLPGDWGTRPLFYYPFGLVVLWGASCGSTLASAGAILSLSTARLIFPILSRELRPGQRHYVTLPVLRATPGNIILVYRAIEVYTKSLLGRFGPIILPGQAFISKFILILNYILIRHGWEMIGVSVMIASIWTVAGQAIWLSLLTMGATFHKEAAATKRSWKGLDFRLKADRKYMNKFTRSCKPLYIGTEGVFRIRKKTVLKFLQGIVRGTFRAVVTLK